MKFLNVKKILTPEKNQIHAVFLKIYLKTVLKFNLIIFVFHRYFQLQAIQKWFTAPQT